MSKTHWLIVSAALSLGAIISPAAAQQVPAAEQFQIQPILELRIRHESVDQPVLEADAFTIRVRAGAQAGFGRLSLLAEGEGTIAPVNNYNAFPFSLPGERQRRPQYAVIADPENAEINRLQLQYKAPGTTITLGRQRINLDDQRWVGSVGWRQNEQTFDALRAESRLGPMGVDVTYMISQRTIFGSDAGPRTSYDGKFFLGGLGAKQGAVQGKLFAYLLDYDESFFLANSSQTYGGTVSGSLPVRAGRMLALRASYARQSDYKQNPFDYSADYLALEASTAFAGFTITGGWEKLGSNRGRAVQTPMATLHKFNGWADMFLTTPPAGLEDAYLSISRRFDGVRRLPGLNANLAFHQFDSAVGDIEYGTEWDASVGFRLRKIGLLLKYSDYRAKGFGLDTRKLWLQAEWAL